MKQFTLARNPIIVNIPAHNVAGIPARETLRYKVEVFILQNNVGILEATLYGYEEPAIVNGSSTLYPGASFDISDIIFANLESSFGCDITSLSPMLANGKTIDYFCKTYVIQEPVGVAPTTTTLATTATATAIWAGLSTEHYEANRTRVYNDILAAKGYLSYKPLDRNMSGGGIDFLSWLYNSPEVITEMQMQVVGTYINGTTATKTIFRIKPRPGRLYHFPCGASVVCSPTDTAKLNPTNLKSYTVVLRDMFNNVIYTQSVKYTIDRHQMPSSVSLIFENSLGGLDVVDCYGENASVINNQSTTAQAFRGFNFEAIKPEEIVSKVQSQQVFELNTRLLHLSESAYLADLVHTYNLAMYVSSSAGKISFVPVSQPKNILRSTDAQDEVGFTLSVGKAYTDSAFSNLPQDKLPSATNFSWQPIAGACQLDAKGKYNGIFEVSRLQKFTTAGVAVLPIETKDNIEGEPGYIPPIAQAICALANTPFRSAAFSMKGSFQNATCATGLVGDFATISVPALEFGSTISQLDANAKAENFAKSLDTQTYANANGPCNTVGVYNPGTIPTGRWWLRLVVGNPSAMALTGISLNTTASYRPGNMWFNSPAYQVDQTDVFTFAADRNDRHYPVIAGGNYEVRAYNDELPATAANRTVRFYRNGLQVGSAVDAKDFSQAIAFPAIPANGDRWYIIFT
jgi:hypothetical protein